jgi:hypothetical protein
VDEAIQVLKKNWVHMHDQELYKMGNPVGGLRIGPLALRRNFSV